MLSRALLDFYGQISNIISLNPPENEFCIRTFCGYINSLTIVWSALVVSLLQFMHRIELVADV